MIKKIKRRIELIVKLYKEDARFSKRLAIYRMIDDTTWRLGLKKISQVFHDKKDHYIISYLEKNLEAILAKYKNDDFVGEYVDNAPIWVCWWTGEDDAPVLVKQCIKSIRKQAGNHPVQLITQDTYKEFLDIPDYIIDKVNDGRMCIANFSDYLRICLIEKYGGLWLDATIYCVEKIPEEYFQRCLFTCKNPQSNSRYISDYRWTSFCLGGWKHNIFYRYFKEAMELYWRQEEYAIDYLLVDYLIEVGYTNIEMIKECFDNVENNNIHKDELLVAMNAAAPASQFRNYVYEDTIFYKLSWRESYFLKTKNGEESVYAMFLKLNI